MAADVGVDADDAEQQHPCGTCQLVKSPSKRQMLYRVIVVHRVARPVVNGLLPPQQRPRVAHLLLVGEEANSPRPGKGKGCEEQASRRSTGWATAPAAEHGDVDVGGKRGQDHGCSQARGADLDGHALLLHIVGVLHDGGVVCGVPLAVVGIGIGNIPPAFSYRRDQETAHKQIHVVSINEVQLCSRLS